MERLNIEYIPWLKMYRVYAPERPAQAVAYYDENEVDIIADDVAEHGYEAVFDEPPEGWRRLDEAMTQPRGYHWYSNNKSLWSGEYKQALVRDKE